MRWLQALHNRTSIFTKVLVANAILIVTGSLTAVMIATQVRRDQKSGLAEEILFVLAGLLVSLGVNYGILRLAFVPLFTLQATLDRVRKGDFSARVPPVLGGIDIVRVTETANLMLDRLAEHRQAVSAQILSAMEEERKRLARELHDETCQSLTSILVNLEMIEKRLPPLPEALTGRLRLTREVAARTLDDTRRLMFDLRPSVLDDLGLVPALRWFISQRVQPMGLQVDFQASNLDERLPDELETALFRVLQEAITNVVKHAQAKHLQVSLIRQAHQIAGVVQDDGIGLKAIDSSGRYEDGRGLGLFGMNERVALVGGSIQVESAPGCGTTVRVVVPDRVGGRLTSG